MSEEKFSKCGEGEKNVNVEFRVFGKKNGNWKKSTEKKSKCFCGWKSKVKDFLSSCSLAGLYVSLQIKVMGKKNDENFQSIFRVGF